MEKIVYLNLSGKACLESDIRLKVGEWEGRAFCAEGRINKKVILYCLKFDLQRFKEKNEGGILDAVPDVRNKALMWKITWYI